MPNVKKVPRKPHPIGQEFKSLADYHTSCILRIDTTCDPKPKEFDDEPGMRNLLATVKRLVKPWFSSGRTVIADSWFGSPDAIMMLQKLGLYSIMHVTKRRYWPRGMPSTDITQQVEDSQGSHYTMYKRCNDGEKIFTCAYRDTKIKAFVSSCGTTILDHYKSIQGRDGSLTDIKRPQVVSEYEMHKSKFPFYKEKIHIILIDFVGSVDTANNRRDNLTSYHDIISNDRWEMRFLGFILGICEANAFSCYKTFADGGDKMGHSKFKDTMAFQLLKHCESLVNTTSVSNSNEQMSLRRGDFHTWVPLPNQNGVKRKRLACRTCSWNGKTGTRVGHCCSCNTNLPLCKNCYNSHLLEVGEKNALSYH
jgi:hypothetical protein